MPEPQLRCSDLTVKVRGRELIRDLAMDVHAGNFVCVLGTNGVGKTLTLETLAGLRQPATGLIELCGEPLPNLRRRDIARRLGMLLQIHEDAFPLTVRESVTMGQFPRNNLWDWSTTGNDADIRSALHDLDLAGLEERPLATLSGGERERTALATLCVQDPAVWLLDEPMNHLDPRHQLHVLGMLSAKAAEGRAIIATVHNPALAMRFASHVLLFYGDGEWEYGPAADLLEPERLQRVYDTPFAYFSNGSQQLLLPS